MRAPRSVVAVIVIVAAFAARSAAQTAVISGTVYRDSAGHQLAAAEILLPNLNRRVSANWAGEFKFDQLPGGRHAIVIRHLGFTPLTDTIEVANGATIDREFILTEHPTSLDTVSVKAPPRKYISPALDEFEERRKVGFGHFIDEAEMRKNNERRLIDVIQSHVPGVSTFNVKGAGSIVGEYLASGRKSVKYNATSSGCGVLRLWTRER